MERVKRTNNALTVPHTALYTKKQTQRENKERGEKSISTRL